MKNAPNEKEPLRVATIHLLCGLDGLNTEVGILLGLKSVEGLFVESGKSVLLNLKAIVNGAGVWSFLVCVEHTSASE